MQTNNAIVVSKRIRYLDPIAICETRHIGPSRWPDNDEALVKYETPEVKAEAQNHCHKISMKRVVAYTGVMMVQWQDEAYTIFAPYHIG
jgi:hypothetical protein